MELNPKYTPKLQQLPPSQLKELYYKIQTVCKSRNLSTNIEHSCIEQKIDSQIKKYDNLKNTVKNYQKRKRLTGVQKELEVFKTEKLTNLADEVKQKEIENLECKQNLDNKLKELFIEKQNLEEKVEILTKQKQNLQTELYQLQSDILSLQTNIQFECQSRNTLIAEQI